MNPEELLIRIDERLKGLKDGNTGDIPEIKEHLKKLNDSVAKTTSKSIRNEARINLMERIGIGVILAMIAALLAVVLRSGG